MDIYDVYALFTIIWPRKLDYFGVVLLQLTTFSWTIINKKKIYIEQPQHFTMFEYHLGRSIYQFFLFSICSIIYHNIVFRSFTLINFTLDNIKNCDTDIGILV